MVLSSSNLMAFVATANPKRARAFYQKTLGLTLLEDTPFALVFDANGIMLRVQKVRSLKPATHTVLGWRVPDIRKAIGALVRKKIRFERYPGLPQDQMGVWSSPSGAKVAWFEDPDGNILSLTEF